MSLGCGIKRSMGNLSPSGKHEPIAQSMEASKIACLTEDASTDEQMNGCLSERDF